MHFVSFFWLIQPETALDTTSLNLTQPLLVPRVNFAIAGSVHSPSTTLRLLALCLLLLADPTGNALATTFLTSFHLSGHLGRVSQLQVWSLAFPNFAPPYTVSPSLD